MRIKTLTLCEFRCFKQYKLDFVDRFTLLIGDNGSGKTAILDSLAIALGCFFLNIPGMTPKEKRYMSPDDVRYTELTMGQTVVREAEEYKTMVKARAFVNDKKITWVRYKNPRASRRVVKALADEVSILIQDPTNPAIFFPVIAYYSTGRLWKELKASEKKTKEPGSRFDGYQDCLNPASDQKLFFRWFKTQELAALQKQTRRHVLEAVRSAIVEMIPGAKRAWWDLDWDELMIETLVQGQSQTIPFHLLSDGYRNMVGMVADIAYRMATLNPQLEADVIKQTEGMVLIDEIDLHLHPKWQRQVVECLLHTFPRVQFVASSHSPFIIQSLYHRNDVLLWDLEKAAPVTIDSKSIEDIAENQQGMDMPQQSQRFLDMNKAAEDYYTVLKQIPPADEAETQRLKQRLDELLLPYSDDPAFQAFLKMQRQAVEDSGH